MKYRDNWDKTMERFNGLWNRELIDRCCISVTAPKGLNSNQSLLNEQQKDKTKLWTDGELIAKRYRDSFENTYFGGDSFPRIPLALGAAGCAGFFMGARYEFTDSTVWFFPYVNEYREELFELDSQSFLYRKTIEIADYLAAESKGDYIIGMPDISGNADALAHMRGTDNFLMDLVDKPDVVLRVLEKIQKVRLKVSRQAFEMVKENNYGGTSIGWLHTWGKGWHDQMQCDLSVMISPLTFETFIMPELLEQAEIFDIPLYHFDGMEQIRHLDMLLSIEKLAAVQWTCVDGQPSPLEFIDVLQKIQNAGKVVLLYAKPEEVELLMTELSSKGLFLIVEAASVKEAKAIEKMADKLTHE